MSKSTLTIAYLSGTVILIFMALAYGASQVIAYFSTGADSTEILRVETRSVNDYYQPKITWKPLDNEGRKMEKSTLNKISKDYLASYFHLQQAYSTGETAGLDDYYIELPRENINQLILADDSEKSRGTTIVHAPKLNFYSEDGTIVTLTDRILSFKKIELEQGSYSFYDTSEYQVMLLLEDNFWRVRHSVKGEFIQDSAIISASKRTLNFNNNQNKIKGINYYPQQHPWQEMWSEFNKNTITKDIRSIESLGFNTVRIFVPFHAFGGVIPSKVELDKLVTFLDLAESNNIKVIVTLFDFFLGYQIEEWTLSDRHAEIIVNVIKNHPALLAWDVKNEPDLDYENFGKEEVNEWLNFIIQRIKVYDSNTPITIGWSQPEAMITHKKEVDFLSFHYYRDPKDLSKILTSIDTDKPIFLGETGMHSFDKWWYPFKNSTSDQLTYYQEIGQAIKEHQLHYAFWTLYDFKFIPSNVAGKWPWQKGPQKSYGIIDFQDNQKPSFHWIKNFNLNNEK